MATNMIDFPRGGEQIKLPQRKRRRDQNESIFKSSDKDDQSTNKKRKTIKIKSNKNTYSTPAKQLVIEKRRIPGWINHKNVAEDTILLGVIKEIQEIVALVSLPYNLIGRIDITDISAVLSQNILEHDSEKSIHNLFHKGQFVVCRVKQVGKGSLGLTCDPVLVNKRVSTSAIQTGMTISGVITAKEDHGYQISFGVEGRVGFLLNKRAKTFIQTHNEGQSLSVGRVLLCHVESGGTRAVPVSIDSDKIKSAAPSLITSFDNIVPFQSVECRVTNVLDSSLILEITGGYTASCAPPHLKRVSDGLERYNMKTVKGRVIWVRQEEKQIGVSLKKSLLQCDITAPDEFEVGEIFEDSEIVRSETRGLFLQLRDTLVGYCPLQNISDEFLSKPDKSHRKGTTHKSRVISYNALDELTVVSLRASVIEEKFLNFKFVKVGDIVQGKIVSRSEKGLLVSLSPHVKGYCPKGHFSERKNQSKSKQKKLQEGCEDTFRVLKIESKQRITLTHKKSIVTSTLPVLSEYTNAVVGHTYHGFIAGVREFGCIVRFYQEVRGILHKSKLQLMPLQAISDLFCEGQVVECCVVSCEPADQKLELSLATDPVQENADYLENFTQVSLTVGGISPNGLELYNSNTNERAALSIYHLSDYKDIQQLRYKSLEKQLKANAQLVIPDLYVYTQSFSGNVCIASLKEGIARDITSDVMINNASEIETGVLIHGVVKRVEKYGFIIGYPGDTTGLLPNRFIRDEFVDSPVGILTVGDSVLTKVMEVTEEGRFVVSSRDSDVKSQNPPDVESINYLGKWFVSYLSTRDTLLKELSVIDILSCYIPGQIVSCALAEMGKEGTIVSLSSGINATVVGLEATELSVGETYSSCILGVSACPMIVYVSLNESLVESYSTEGVLISELAVGSSVQARIELVLPKYMVGLVATLHGPRLVYIIREVALSTKSFQNILEQYMNKRVNVVILNDILYSDSMGIALGLLMEGSQLSSTQKKRLVRDREDVNIGSIVTAQVKEVHALMLKVRVGAYSGRILASEISDNPIEGKFPTKTFQKGETVRARVVSKSLKLTDNLLKREYTVLDMTMRTSKMSVSVESIPRLQLDNIGDSCYGCVEEIWPNSNLVISIGSSRSLYIPLLLCNQDINVLRNLDKHFKLGQTVKVELIKKQKKGRKSTGTLISKHPIEIGTIVCVQVTHVYSNQALIVSLPFGETARIEVTDICDSYSKDMTDGFADKQLLQAKVIAIEDKIIMSTRESCIGEFLMTDPVVKNRVVNSIHDLTKGEIIRGFVKAATDVGVFVKLSRTITGRVRIKNMSDQFIRKI
ncbi:Protein RRP5-like [Oopsacas minuta]|uniref:Protein RRP5-like n=1 Tax=Oopsacas minuta TaxID=111878 RepID=A0AAV7K7J8_9METZ|nr:Protein RRP5-like [Oopsacas minuta]